MRPCCQTHTRNRELQCDHAVEGVECPRYSARSPSSQECFNVTTPLKAWNVIHVKISERGSSRFNVTTPLKAWNGGGGVANARKSPLQCDHAVEGVECSAWLAAHGGGEQLQCDHAVEGVE